MQLCFPGGRESEVVWMLWSSPFNAQLPQCQRTVLSTFNLFMYTDSQTLTISKISSEYSVPSLATDTQQTTEEKQGDLRLDRVKWWDELWFWKQELCLNKSSADLWLESAYCWPSDYSSMSAALFSLFLNYFFALFQREGAVPARALAWH